MTEEIKNGDGTRPETPSLDNKQESNVVENISEKLGSEAKSETTTNTNKPQAKKAPKINLNDLSKEQIQDLQELFANTPRRDSEIDTYNTVELRTIGDKIIVETGKSYFAYRNDPEQRKEVLKTIIPVKFKGEDKFTDILWREEFMNAEKITCKIISMNKEEKKKLTGESTYKRNDRGEQTSQLVDMYVTEIEITLEIELPNKEIIKINGAYAN